MWFNQLRFLRLEKKNKWEKKTKFFVFYKIKSLLNQKKKKIQIKVIILKLNGLKYTKC